MDSDLGGEEFGFLFWDSSKEGLREVIDDIFDLISVEGEHLLKSFDHVFVIWCLQENEVVRLVVVVDGICLEDLLGVSFFVGCDWDFAVARFADKSG